MALIVRAIMLLSGLSALIRGSLHWIHTDKMVEKTLTRKRKGNIFSSLSSDRQRIWMRVKGALLVVMGIIFLISFPMNGGRRPSAQATLVQGSNQAGLVYQNIIQDYLSDNAVPGMVVGIVDGDEELIYTYGMADLRTQTPVDSQTVFEIGSVSKVFTGLMLADAVNSGQVTLDDSVNDVLVVDDAVVNPLFDEITLRQLTTHTSGLPRLPQSMGFMVNVWWTGLTQGNPYAMATTDYVMDQMQRLDSVDGVGEWAYSNYAVGIQGMCMAAVHSSAYEEVLQSRIAQPLGMERTTSQDTTCAIGYPAYQPIGPWQIHIPGQPWVLGEGIVGAGGIRSNGEDMMRFLRALVDESLPAVTTAIQPIYLWGEDHMGMNWIMQPAKADTDTLIWHNGQTGGFYAYVGFYREQAAGVYILTNSTHRIEDLAEQLLEMVE